MMLVLDEVQSGMGRTGKMFAAEHFGVTGDIVNIAKGIASGLPLGITCARAEVMSWPPGAHASTFGGNPVSCAAALVTIKLLREQYVQNAATVGDYMMNALRELQNKHQIIGDVRGRGLMIGVELVRDRKTKERAVEERNAARPGDVQARRADPRRRPERDPLRAAAGHHEGPGGRRSCGSSTSR